MAIMAARALALFPLPCLASGALLRAAPGALGPAPWSESPIAPDLDLTLLSTNSTALGDNSVDDLYPADCPVELLFTRRPKAPVQFFAESALVRHFDRDRYVHGGWRRTAIRMVVVLVAASVVFGALGAWHTQIRDRTGIKVEHVCCAAYAALSISIDLSIKNAARVNGGVFPFNPACAVVAVEALKFIVSMVLFTTTARMQVKEGIELVMPGFKDVAWMMIPGFVYTCNNIIVFEAIGHCPLGAFGVIRETMLIWNALLWTIVFQAAIGRTRWFAILLLFVGCVVNQLPAFFRAEFTWGVLWAFLLAFSNAAGGVANEYAMKRKAAMDINLQNCILYFFCGCFGMIYLLLFQMSDLRAGFFNGFSPQCIQVVILQMLTGLAVSRILKYVDAVTKTIVAAFRGPGVIFFGAWIFHTTLHLSEIAATVVVCIACWIYLREGPLVKAADVAKEGKEVK